MSKSSRKAPSNFEIKSMQIDIANAVRRKNVEFNSSKDFSVPLDAAIEYVNLGREMYIWDNALEKDVLNPFWLGENVIGQLTCQEEHGELYFAVEDLEDVSNQYNAYEKQFSYVARKRISKNVIAIVFMLLVLALAIGAVLTIKSLFVG